MISGSDDGKLITWNSTTELRNESFEGLSISAYASLGRGSFAVGFSSGSLYIRRVTGPYNASILTNFSIADAHANGVIALSGLPNFTLASGGKDNNIKLWNISDGSFIATLAGHSGCLLLILLINFY